MREPESLPLEEQDLSKDVLLLHLPRDEAGRPTLGGIPLLRQLGRGAMGAVYYAMHPRLHMEVAIKVLPSQLLDQDPSLLARFRSEARIAATIGGDHLVKVFDVGSEADTPFLVMEYVPGETATAFLRRVGSPGLPEREALHITRAALRGLAVAHEKGIIHRDIKPDNILIPNGELKKAKLADLGLAKLEHGGAGQTVGTLANVAMGTPGFMAPEQAEDARSAGKAADVFSTGATLYALLTGHAPFRGTSLAVVLRDTLTREPEPLPTTISSAVRTIVWRCLHKDPKQRFTSAHDLLAAIEGSFAGPTPAAETAPTAIAPPRADHHGTHVPGAAAGRPRTPWLAIAIIVSLIALIVVVVSRR
jgi:serine/threonine protein kinase